jgi:hypothetical protein
MFYGEFELQEFYEISHIGQLCSCARKHLVGQCGCRIKIYFFIEKRILRIISDSHGRNNFYPAMTKYTNFLPILFKII